jgi:predicted DNA-binding WGR domain protein
MLRQTPFVRGFEYVGGGNEKFWEIRRDGTTVTVRFGRAGSAGQTQSKDLGSAAAAAAHVEKLVAAKVKKGYVEITASEVASATASVPVPAPGRVDPPRAAPPAVDPIPADPGLPDETTFVLPSAWARRAEPFRGLRPAPKLAIDVAATRAEADGLRQRAEPLVQEVLAHPSSDPDLVERARRHRGTGAARQDDPLGAAALLEVYARAAFQGRPNHQELDRLGALLADDLVLAHGIPFAAETGAHLIDVILYRLYPVDRGQVLARRHLQGGMTYDWLVTRPVLTRLRAHLAAAPDNAYAGAVARLATLREGSAPTVRMVTSYLTPTEQPWVREDIAAIPGARIPPFLPAMLLATAAYPADVDAVLAVADAWGPTSVLSSIVANLGLEAIGPLVTVLDGSRDADLTKQALRMVAALPTDEALAALADRVDRKYVRPALMDAMGRYPVRAAQLLAARANGADAAARICRDLLRDHVVSHPELVEHANALGPAATAALESVRRPPVPVADPADLPGILVTPPWEKRKTPAAPPVVPGLAPPDGLALRWKQGEREEWATRRVRYDHSRSPAEWASIVVEATTPGRPYHRYWSLCILAAAPLDLVRPHLAWFISPEAFEALPALQRILARFGDEGLDFTMRHVPTQPRTLAPALLPIEGAEVASRMAAWLQGKALRSLARTWLERHPDTAARDLVPAALGKPGRDRSAAEAALRALDQAGHRDAVRTAAARYGPDAAAAVDAILDADPLDRLPARVPARPTWLDPVHLPQVLLRDRSTALPTAAVGHFCTMLALSTPGDTYAGVDVVKAATDPSSLAELAWDLLERWRGAGFPSKDGWVMEALALLGNDETVRRLAPLVRAWPGEGGHARAVAALDVLATIGTEVALMHLHGIAEKAKFKGLRTRAQEKIGEVAEGLGLSPEQLADRLVPDLGLDRGGSMGLDYGPRRFTVGFDEQLKPVVADEDGSRRKALPKPTAKDDPALAPAAHAAFGALKKDVRTIAADQIRRFEQAMVQGRRWSAAEQRALFVEHPLLWHLTRRLVWGTFDDTGAVTGSFRVAEDRTLAHADDTEVTLADDTVVGIAHPLHLGDQLEAWSELFADYEILQPFPQLGRDTWALTAEEEQATVLHRLGGAVIPTGRVLGLAHRGWERGEVMDAGISHVMCKPTTGARTMVIDLDPGIIAGMATEWNEQRITAVWVTDGPPSFGSDKGDRPFSELDALTASELLRDLEHLRG